MLQGAEEEKWRAVAENAHLWDTNDIKVEIHPAIRLSYHYLPASLKRCFEFLAIFSTDHKFDQDYVVRLWIADGLVQEVDGRLEEDIGNEYYNELKAKSLIQENDKMHDIVHHLASLLSRKFCYKENSKEPYDSVRHALVDKLNGWFLAEAPCLRTLIIDNFDTNRNDLLGALLSCKMLRTLEIRKYSYYDPYPDIFILRKVFMGNLTHLRYLAIERTDVRHLTNFLCKMDNLQFLYLVGSVNLETLPESICALGQLQVLDLHSCHRLTQLPKDMGNMSRLRTLDLRETSIISLPESICDLSQLQVLGISYCGRLTQLPKDMCKISRLRILHLSSCTSIISLPESICALSQLQVLDLHNCWRITQLPKDMGNISRLRTLNLCSTPIISLPESICFLGQSQVLDLGFCGLKQLPEDIGKLRSLRTLDLSQRSILSLPKSICALPQLQVLHLRGCGGLKELPQDIGNLRSLHTLDLGCTTLSMPKSILHVSGLQVLQVNKQEQLPSHIGRLTRLEALPVLYVRKEEGLRLSELNLMNSLRGKLTIASMENIQNVEEASMANLKSKTNVRVLHFLWTRPNNDEEKILEVLKPHHTLKSMQISNYSGGKFPDWIMSRNICLGNLRELRLQGLNKICEMVGVEFVSLEELHIENCPRLRKVLMATPKLNSLLLLSLGGNF